MLLLGFVVCVLLCWMIWCCGWCCWFWLWCCWVRFECWCSWWLLVVWLFWGWFGFCWWRILFWCGVWWCNLLVFKSLGVWLVCCCWCLCRIFVCVLVCWWCFCIGGWIICWDCVCLRMIGSVCKLGCRCRLVFR